MRGAMSGHDVMLLMTRRGRHIITSICAINARHLTHLSPLPHTHTVTECSALL